MGMMRWMGMMLRKSDDKRGLDDFIDLAWIMAG